MIVKTLLDTDLYKFTTSYAYIKLFPYAMGTFSFNDRNETKYTEAFLETLKAEIKNLSQLRFTEEELEYMTKNCRFLPRVYWEWLSSFRFDPNKIDIHLDEACHLHIEVTDLLYKVTLYEVPLLAIVSEIKNRFFGHVADMNGILCKLSEKIELSNQHQLRFSEFGTRRRFSIDVQEAVIKKLNETAQYCTGTSNCNFAMKYGMKMMGTHPHEWFMFHGAQFGYKHANYMALENWFMTVIWVSHFPIHIHPASSLATLAVNKLNFSTVCAAIPAMNLNLSTDWLPATKSWESMRQPKPSYSAMPSTLQKH